jgi:probable HAF family extracellular repeat protein
MGTDMLSRAEGETMRTNILLLITTFSIWISSACGGGAAGGSGGNGGGGGNPSAATHFSVTAAQAVSVGSAFNFTVTARDAANNVASAYAGTVRFSSTDSQAMLPLNSTLANGSGNFSATLETAGNQTITATDSGSPAITGVSNSIDVTSNQSSLTITSGQMPNGVVGEPYGPFQLLGHCSIVQDCPLYFFKLTASGGTGSYSWSMAAAPGSSLPIGISCCTLIVEHVFPGPIGQTLYSPVVYGTPTTAGNYKVNVTVKDQVTQEQTSATYAITISAAEAANQAAVFNVHHLARHHHYKLVDLGTFGGPQSYLNDAAGLNSVVVLNNREELAGWADTPLQDSNSPNSCFDPDCFTAHAFQWKNGVKSDLGVLPGGTSSQPNWISQNGLIAGVADNGEIDPLVTAFPQHRAVLWQHGKITDLGVLPQGGYESVANSVNSRGQVIGFALNTIPDSNSMAGIGFQTRAFLWENGVMQDLGTLNGSTDAQSVVINERGQVVGLSYTSSAPSSACAGFGLPMATGSFAWDKEHGMIDLGGFGGTCTVASGLNDRGQVVGESFLPGDQGSRAFLWERMTGLQELETLGGDFAEGFSINNDGEAVGGSYLQGDVQIDAVLWGSRGITDLGALKGDTCAFALSINVQRQVVGSSNCFFESTRGFLWEDGGPMVELNALVSHSSNLYVTVGLTVNNHGEIAADAVLPNGDEHAVLLIPCDETHPKVEGCDYSLVDSVAGEGRGNFDQRDGTSSEDSKPERGSTPTLQSPSGEKNNSPKRFRPRLAFAPSLKNR